MKYIVHNRVYCAKFSKVSWTVLRVQEYDIKHNTICCLYKVNMLDTAYVTVQVCNLKLQHRTNFEILHKREIYGEISKILEICMLHVAKTQFFSDQDSVNFALTSRSSGSECPLD